MSAGDHNLADLLTRARAGSEEALGEVLETCRTYLMIVAGKNLDPGLRAKAGASDLVQQTFLEAQRDFGQFGGGTEEELQAWLRRVLLNNMANFGRAFRGAAKRDVERELSLQIGQSSADWRQDLAVESGTASVFAVREEGMQALENALKRLPDEYQQTIHYRYREERSFEEIGRLMGRSGNAARKLWLRALEKLQKELDSDAPE